MPRKGTHTVDYETLKNKLEAKGWTWAKIASNADISVSNFNHWKAGGGAKPENLKAVAKALGTSYRTLILNDIPPAELGKPETPEAQYREIMFDALMSQDFEAFARSQGGYDVTDVEYFLRLKYHEQLYHISLSPAERDELHKELCFIGMTEFIEVERGRNKGRTILAWRPWNPRQCDEAVELRIINEQATVRRAIRLQCYPDNLQACEEARMIRKQQDEILAEMAIHNADLRKPEKATKAALVLIKLDTQFHLNWAGTSPIHQLAMKMMTQQVRQAIDRFVQALRYAGECEFDLPVDIPTLQDFTCEFYAETSELFDLFLAASPDDEGSLQKMDAAIDRHSRGCYCIVDKADQLMKHIRRYNIG